MTVRIDTRLVVRILLAAAAVAGSMGGCECGKEEVGEDHNALDRPTITEENPQVERPNVYFPRDLMTEDVSLNKFVDKALNVCYEGDYDGFRQLFGASYKPPKETNFQAIWTQVRSVQVARIEQHPGKEPPVYYLHAVVRLRNPDSKGRTRRDIVIAIFPEAGQWRLGNAPEEVTRFMLGLSGTQASGDGENENLR